MALIAKGGYLMHDLLGYDVAVCLFEWPVRLCQLLDYVDCGDIFINAPNRGLRFGNDLG